MARPRTRLVGGPAEHSWLPTERRPPASDANEGKIVSEVGDRLCSWEYALASEAAAKKLACPCCRGDLLMPVSREDAGVGSVYTFCLVCKRAVAPIVKR